MAKTSIKKGDLVKAVDIRLCLNLKLGVVYTVREIHDEVHILLCETPYYSVFNISRFENLGTPSSLVKELL